MVGALDALANVVPENAIRFLGHPPHRHDVPQLIHVVNGIAEVTVGGQAMTLRARDNLWLAADIEHEATYAPGSVVLGPFLSAHAAPPQAMQRLGVVPQITHVMQMVLAAGPGCEAQVLPFRRALEEILNAVGDHRYFALAVPHHPVARAVARRAASKSTLEELAREQCMSTRHIQRVFQSETGLPFRQWRARARLNVAIARLRGGDSLTIAAHRAGFASRSGLLKALSRETGIPERTLAHSPIEALDHAH